jgi:hypothetical protein
MNDEWEQTEQVSRQDEGTNLTFQKLPAKTKVRIFFKRLPPIRGVELNCSEGQRPQKQKASVTRRHIIVLNEELWYLFGHDDDTDSVVEVFKVVD